MRKTVNLQPWLDYFGMLRKYEEKGYLELSSKKNEAYITEAALMTLANIDQNQEDVRRLRAVADVLRRIHAYAAWKAHQGYEYLQQPYAMHIVKDDAPHDLKATLLMTSRRRWWWPFVKREHFDVTTYC